MPNTSHSLLHFIRTVAGAWHNDPRDDDQLLARFVNDHDEVAFQTLVYRHAPMVWQTCKRVLRSNSDAEDAFQVTFVALTRKAGKLRGSTLAGWLHRVARQTALNTDLDVRRRQRLEHRPAAVIRTEERDVGGAELRAALDEELSGLPEKLRIPLVLRYLEEKTQEEVARILGCSRSVALRRLAKGEAILRERLERRGMTLGALSLATLLANNAGSPAVPAGLIANTAKAAVSFRAGTLSGASAEAAERLLRSLSWKGAVWSKWWVVMAVCFLGMGGVSGLVAWKVSMSGEDVGVPIALTAPEPVLSKATAKSNGVRVDCYGDPLPPGALARIGTTRLRPLKGDPFSSGIAFLPDGKTLISLNGGFLYFWEWPSGKELRRTKSAISLSGKPIERFCGIQIAVSPDGKVLATNGKYWDIISNPPRQLKREKAPATWEWESNESSVAYSPDGQTVAWAWAGGGRAADCPEGSIIYLVDAASGEVKKTLKDETCPGDEYAGGWCMAFSADSKTLAAGGLSGRTILWDVASGKKRLQIDGNGKRVASLRFLPDGRTLMESRWSNSGVCLTTRFLDAATGVGQKSTDLPRNLNSFSGMNRCISKCLSSDGKLLASNEGNVISVWDMATEKEVGPVGGIHGPVGHLIFSSDGRKLITCEAPIRLWDAATGHLEKELGLATRSQELGAPFSYFFSDTRHFEILSHLISPATKTWTRQFLRWDIETGKTEQAEEAVPATLARGQKSVPHSAASSNGQWLAVAFTEEKGIDDSDIVLVERATCREARRFSGLSHPSYTTFSADGQLLLAKSSDGHQLYVWSTSTGKNHICLDLKSSSGNSLGVCALSPDSRWLAVVSYNERVDRKRFIHLWDVTSGTELGEFEAIENDIYCLAWSFDGRLLAGGGGSLSRPDCVDGDGTVWLWDVATGQEIGCFKGHRSFVKTLSFSSDGLRLASGSYDTTALVWDLSHLLHLEETGATKPSLDELWATLRKPDAASAWQAIYLLTRHPDASLPLLRERLQPTSARAPKVTALLTQLDDDNFQERKRAEEQLVKMGETIETTLLNALTKKLSPEVQARIKDVLSKFCVTTPRGLYPSQLQAYRGVAVLERIGTPAARQVLEELSRLPAETTQAKEAKAALQRLTKPVPIFMP